MTCLLRRSWHKVIVLLSCLREGYVRLIAGCAMAGSGNSARAAWLPNLEDSGRHSSAEDGRSRGFRHAQQEGEPDLDCKGLLRICTHLRDELPLQS